MTVFNTGTGYDGRPSSEQLNESELHNNVSSAATLLIHTAKKLVDAINTLDQKSQDMNLSPNEIQEIRDMLALQYNLIAISNQQFNDLGDRLSYTSVHGWSQENMPLTDKMREKK